MDIEGDVEGGLCDQKRRKVIDSVRAKLAKLVTAGLP